MISAVLCALLAVDGHAMARKPPVEKTTMDASGQYGKVTEPGARVVETREQWDKLWKELEKPAPAGEPDFAKQFAVAVFAGERPTGGWRIAFDEPLDEGGATVVRYAIVKPTGMVTQAFTHPYSVKVFAKTGKPVKLEAK